MSIRCLLWTLMASLSFSLGGCGGGGGGGGGGGDAVGVSIGSHTPALLETRAFEGKGYGVGMDVRLSGNLASLDGKQVYVFVEVSGDVLKGQPQISIDPEGGAGIVLTNAPDEEPTAGVYEGTARFSACLDAACNSQLEGSPFTVPYKVTIEPGLRLSTQAIEKDVTFATKPSATRVTVGLPKGSTEWTVTDSMHGSAYSVGKATDGTAAIDIVFSLKEPGTYTETLFVDTSAPSLEGDGRLELFQTYFTVTYTVREDHTVAPVAFDPKGGTYSFAEGTSQQGTEQFLLVHQAGTLSFVGPIYLSAPPAAAGSPQVNDWIWDEGAPMNEYSVLPCDTVGGSVENCLPPGEYRGAVRFRHTSPEGVVTDVDYPISMTIH